MRKHNFVTLKKTYEASTVMLFIPLRLFKHVYNREAVETQVRGQGSSLVLKLHIK